MRSLQTGTQTVINKPNSITNEEHNHTEGHEEETSVNNSGKVF